MSEDAASVAGHGVNLPAPARDAWRAYCDMLASKEAHFGFLESLHLKYRHGGQRTLAEITRLAQLLAEHDRCVRDFARRMRELGAADRGAHGDLVTAIAALNQSLGGPERRAGH